MLKEKCYGRGNSFFIYSKKVVVWVSKLFISFDINCSSITSNFYSWASSFLRGIKPLGFKRSCIS